jgi:beta-lactamase superfamily II metal-dependent hydrolase
MGASIRLLAFAAACVAAVPASRTQAPDTTIVHLIDVGQGAATLLEFPCGAALIDTGGENVGDFKTNEHFLPYLNDFFARRTDLGRTLALVVLSHPHPDHYAGVSVLLDSAKRLTIENVVDNSQQIAASSPQVKLRKAAKAVGQTGARGGRHAQLPDDRDAG